MTVAQVPWPRTAEPATTEGPLRRLSTIQESMWFLHRLDPGSAAYNVLLAVRVRTSLDARRLATAVAAVQSRHPLLRSTFTEVEGTPWRVVRPAPEPHASALVVRDVPEVTHEHLGILAQRSGAAPFRLSAGEVPFRVVLLRARPDDASLVVAAHHIVADASSLALILRDLLTAYRDAGETAGPTLPELPRSYDDYVVWERNLLSSPKGARLADHWRDVCGSGRPARLPADNTAPPRPRRRGASVEFELPGPTAEQLRTASRSSGTTPFAYLLGAYQAMLYRCTGQSRFLIGTAATLRFAAGLRSVVGPMVNTVPLAAAFEPGTTVADTVSAAARQVARAMVNAPYPLARMAADSPMLSSGQDGALFRTTLTLLAVDHMEPPLPMARAGAAEGAEIVYAGVRMAHLNVAQQEGQFDLSVELRHGRSSVTGVLRYDVDLFEPSTIERLAGLYCRFVHHIVNHPPARVADLPMVEPAELARLLALGGN